MAKKTLKLPYWIGDYVYWQDLYENKISSGIISKIVIYGYDIYYYAYDVSVNLLVRLPPEKIYFNYKAAEKALKRSEAKQDEKDDYDM
ncbi:hypothetical protein V6C42_12915 [Pseudoclostridium thermosuccinogenes]|uniref:hypothetical protein n=1 Tax=Clostridium thermosuccinogenes TaxID=84032 RepID=UPI002FD9D2DE